MKKQGRESRLAQEQERAREAGINAASFVFNVILK